MWKSQTVCVWSQSWTWTGFNLLHRSRGSFFSTQSISGPWVELCWMEKWKCLTYSLGIWCWERAGLCLSKGCSSCFCCFCCFSSQTLPTIQEADISCLIPTACTLSIMVKVTFQCLYLCLAATGTRWMFSYSSLCPMLRIAPYGAAWRDSMSSFVGDKGPLRLAAL